MHTQYIPEFDPNQSVGILEQDVSLPCLPPYSKTFDFSNGTYFLASSGLRDFMRGTYFLIGPVSNKDCDAVIHKK